MRNNYSDLEDDALKLKGFFGKRASPAFIRYFLRLEIMPNAWAPLCLDVNRMGSVCIAPLNPLTTVN